MKRTAIVGASGSFKGVFVQGVLKAFEKQKFYADAYASASSSSIPIALASIKSLISFDDLIYWKRMYSFYRNNGMDIAQAMLNEIASIAPQLKEKLLNSDKELLISLSEVISQEAAELTQSDKARLLGKELLIATKRGNNAWAKENLKQIFASTQAKLNDIQLTELNLDSVLYATTRMMHAWKYPAEVDNRPMIDASYTCSCAAVEMLDRGFDNVIAIVPKTGKIPHNFFNTYFLNDHPKAHQIEIIQPHVDLKTIGLDYLKVKEGAFEIGFKMGVNAGNNFVKNIN